MMFLLRAAFWLTVVALLLPSGHSSTATAPQVNAVDAVSAAGAAVSDMSQFCARQPNACVVGSQAATAVGQKAQAGAKRLYELLTERLGSNDGAATPTKAPDRPPMPTARPSHNTLTPADLAPAWRGPEQPKKEAHARRPA